MELVVFAALSCLTESIKENPEKYASIIYENMPSAYSLPSYSSYPYGQQHHQPSYYDTQAMLEEDAAKLYDELAKNLENEILIDYTVSTSPQPLLLLLSSSEDFPPKAGAAAERDTVNNLIRRNEARDGANLDSAQQCQDESSWRGKKIRFLKL